MPVSLDDMMIEMTPEDRAKIERDASALAADFRRRSERPDVSLRNQASAIGMKATTGQRCPQSGIWKVENTISTTVPIAIHNLMPPYANRAVTWVLVERA